MNTPTAPTYMPSLLWLWAPVTFFFSWLVFEQALPNQAIMAVSESGAIENIQVFITFFAAIIGLRHLRIDASAHPYLFGWFAVAIFTCIYIFGEEISWGQWIFFWDTPESWAAINDQGETNLHNTSSWLDQKPRTILETGLVFGTIIMPWLMKRYPERFSHFWRTVMPDARLLTIGLVFSATKLLDVIGDTWNIRVYYRASELLECYLYYFFFLYLLGFNNRPFRRVAR